MKLYEALFILSPELAPDAQKAQVDNLEGVIRKFGGTVSEKIELGRKPLGYALKKFREGAFWCLNFSLESIKSGELRKALELDETLLKFMVTAKEVRPAPKKVAVKAPAAPAKPHRETGASSHAAAPHA